jgi:putative transcriptional regulator
MTKKYRSKICAVVYETVVGLNRAVPMDRKTMREFDVLCLTPIQKMSPRKIRAIREREQTSQTVFAAYLNVTPGLVSKWERGEKFPRGASLKLLALIDKKGLDIVA